MQITKNDDGATNYDAAGILVQYTVEVYNPGPNAAIGVTLTQMTSNLNGITWSCTGSLGAAVCPLSSGPGLTFDLPANSSLQFTVSATSGSTSNGDLVHIVTVVAPAGITDPNSLNNSKTDRDTLIVANSIPTGPIGNIPAGTYNDYTVTKFTAISGSHLIYQPIYSGGLTVDMDLVILQVGDGRNWYTVFDWGDGSPDINSDIPYSLNSTPCTSEPDNCPIDVSQLTNPPGVTIQLNSGLTISYIRIKSPSGGDSGDGLDVNTITVP